MKKYLITGLLVWIPIIVTVFIARFVINILDKSVALLPHAYQPEVLLGRPIPGLGIVVCFLIIFITGILATNLLGKAILRWFDRIMDKLPLIRTIYSASKQVMETLMKTNSDAFRKVLLIEYPRRGIWSIAFQTGMVSKKISEADDHLVSAFVPTTPNPTSGFIVLVPKESVREIDIPVEQAIKFIVSLGTVSVSSVEDEKKLVDHD